MEENSSRCSSKQVYFYTSEIGLAVQFIQSRGCRKGREGWKREEPEIFPCIIKKALQVRSLPRSLREKSLICGNYELAVNTVFTATDTASFCVIAHLSVCREIEIVYFACWIQGSVLVTSRKSYFLRELLHYKQVIHDISVSVVRFNCSQNINH